MVEQRSSVSDKMSDTDAKVQSQPAMQWLDYYYYYYYYYGCCCCCCCYY